MVPEVGLGPTLAEAHTALNRARLPIPPLRHGEERPLYGKGGTGQTSAAHGMRPIPASRPTRSPSRATITSAAAAARRPHLPPSATRASSTPPPTATGTIVK